MNGFEIKESSFNRCRETVALVSGRFCMNRFLERVVIYPGEKNGICIGLWSKYVDDSNEYGTGIRQKFDYRLPDDIKKDLKYALMDFLRSELQKEEQGKELSDLREIKIYLGRAISKLEYKIEDGIRRESYDEGFEDGQKPETGEDEFLKGLQ